MSEKLFFVVLRSPSGQETPCLYHDEIPTSVRGDILYAWRLEGETHLSLGEMMEEYEVWKRHDILPPSNVDGSNFARKF